MATQAKVKARPIVRENRTEDGVRMVRVRSMLENPKGQIETPKGPRLVELGEEFEIPEDKFSPRWMEPIDEVDPSLSEERRLRGRVAVREEVIAGIKRDQDMNRQLYGESDEERLAGLARERPAPPDVMP